VTESRRDVTVLMRIEGPIVGEALLTYFGYVHD
jgi:hypothetical protein